MVVGTLAWFCVSVCERKKLFNKSQASTKAIYFIVATIGYDEMSPSSGTVLRFNNLSQDSESTSAVAAIACTPFLLG